MVSCLAEQQKYNLSPSASVRLVDVALAMQGMGPAIAGVRLSDRPILGPAPVTTSAGAEAPGMLDRVKQLVGLGPSVVCFHLQCLISRNTCRFLSEEATLSHKLTGAYM